jgi:hypothetical protein
MSDKKPQLIAYTITENEGKDDFWTRIGAAWPNSKGGFNIELNAMPLNGKLILLPPKETE